MRYWWVNHKQTSAHEIAGGFLWSPMFKANGTKNHFYETMRMASPGDRVISYAGAKISCVGVVTGFAMPTPKPPSFGSTGENWDKDNGWLLPVAWSFLKEAIKPKDFFSDLKEVLPRKYSPINLESGKGNQVAYLAEVDKAVFDVLLGELHIADETRNDSETVPVKVLAEIDDVITQAILADKELDSTTKSRVIQSRLGQGKFRDYLSRFEASCRLTGVTNPALLIASHIKPWRLCKSALERLDGANGFLLTPNVDRLFDSGWISFNDDGAVLVSPRLDVADLDLLGVKNVEFVLGGAFHERQKVYLKFHRDNVFLK